MMKFNKGFRITGGKLDFCFKFLITSFFRKTIIFLKNILVYAILLVDLIMEKIHET